MLFRRFVLSRIAVIAVLHGRGLRSRTAVCGIDVSIQRQREARCRLGVNVLLLHWHDGRHVRFDSVQLACTIVELLRWRGRGSGWSWITLIHRGSGIFCLCGIGRYVDVCRGKLILPIADREYGLQSLQLGQCGGSVCGSCFDRARREVSDECSHIGIDALTDGNDAWHILVNMLKYQCHRIVRSERHLACEHFPSHDAYGVQVALRRGLVPLNHFRRQICGRSKQDASGGKRCLRNRFGQTEIGDLHMAAVVEQNVLRLDVAMHHARTVCGSKAIQRFTDDA